MRLSSMTEDQDLTPGDALFQKLGKGPKDADYELDLTGLVLPHARDSLTRMLERNRFRPSRSVVVRLDKPVEGGGETLFQPIGRMLLDARRGGLLSTLGLLPPEDGIGYRLETVGKSEAADATEPDQDPKPDFDPHDSG
jgi:hypothetical protein